MKNKDKFSVLVGRKGKCRPCENAIRPTSYNLKRWCKYEILMEKTLENECFCCPSCVRECEDGYIQTMARNKAVYDKYNIEYQGSGAEVVKE